MNLVNTYLIIGLLFNIMANQNKQNDNHGWSLIYSITAVIYFIGAAIAIINHW